MNVKKVIKKMGASYCCHPANHVQRLTVPLADSVGTDLRKTFERIREQQEQPVSNVTKIVVAR